jgi:hypothetical protein
MRKSQPNRQKPDNSHPNKSDNFQARASVKKQHQRSEEEEINPESHRIVRKDEQKNSVPPYQQSKAKSAEKEEYFREKHLNVRERHEESHQVPRTLAPHRKQRDDYEEDAPKSRQPITHPKSYHREEPEDYHNDRTFSNHNNNNDHHYHLKTRERNYHEEDENNYYNSKAHNRGTQDIRNVAHSRKKTDDRSEDDNHRPYNNSYYHHDDRNNERSDFTERRRERNHDDDDDHYHHQSYHKAHQDRRQSNENHRRGEREEPTLQQKKEHLEQQHYQEAAKMTTEDFLHLLEGKLAIVQEKQDQQESQAREWMKSEEHCRFFHPNRDTGKGGGDPAKETKKKGWCKNGDKCPYFHDIPKSERFWFDSPCKFFAKGICRDREKCIFLHYDPVVYDEIKSLKSRIQFTKEQVERFSHPVPLPPPAPAAAAPVTPPVPKAPFLTVPRKATGSVASQQQQYPPSPSLSIPVSSSSPAHHHSHHGSLPPPPAPHLSTPSKAVAKGMERSPQPVTQKTANKRATTNNSQHQKEAGEDSRNADNYKQITRQARRKAFESHYRSKMENGHDDEGDDTDENDEDEDEDDRSPGGKNETRPAPHLTNPNGDSGKSPFGRSRWVSVDTSESEEDSDDDDEDEEREKVRYKEKKSFEPKNTNKRQTGGQNNNRQQQQQQQHQQKKQSFPSSALSSRVHFTSSSSSPSKATAAATTAVPNSASPRRPMVAVGGVSKLRMKIPPQGSSRRPLTSEQDQESRPSPQKGHSSRMIQSKPQKQSSPAQQSPQQQQGGKRQSQNQRTGSSNFPYLLDP